jgi:hypothetical protein
MSNRIARLDQLAVRGDDLASFDHVDQLTVCRAVADTRGRVPDPVVRSCSRFHVWRSGIYVGTPPSGS